MFELVDVVYVLPCSHCLSKEANCPALAVKQFAVKVIALQWIFAFVIFAVFFIESVYLSGTKYYGRNSLFQRVAAPETDREREPLLPETR